MNGDKDSPSMDITQGADPTVTDYSAQMQESYQDRYGGKSLTDFEKTSGAIVAAKMHEFPMDPPDVQSMKIGAMMNLPDPKKVWLLYYQGAYLRKYGMKNQATGLAPGEISLVSNRENIEDITEG